MSRRRIKIAINIFRQIPARNKIMAKRGFSTLLQGG